jgi:hypothetical protein
MKRLEIVLVGYSRAIGEAGAELETHGHLIHTLRDVEAIKRSVFKDAMLMIEDGTLDVSLAPPEAFGLSAHLGLRLGLTSEDDRTPRDA